MGGSRRSSLSYVAEVQFAFVPASSRVLKLFHPFASSKMLFAHVLRRDADAAVDSDEIFHLQADSTTKLHKRGRLPIPLTGCADGQGGL